MPDLHCAPGRGFVCSCDGFHHTNGNRLGSLLKHELTVVNILEVAFLIGVVLVILVTMANDVNPAGVSVTQQQQQQQQRRGEWLAWQALLPLGGSSLLGVVPVILVTVADDINPASNIVTKQQQQQQCRSE
jgi:hypothetical protein